MDKDKFTPQTGLRIMELVTQIAVAREASELGARSTENTEYIGEIDELVRTLFSTMCELLPSEGSVSTL